MAQPGADQSRAQLSNRMKDRIAITSLEAKRQQQNSTSSHDKNSQKSVCRKNMPEHSKDQIQGAHN